MKTNIQTSGKWRIVSTMAVLALGLFFSNLSLAQHHEATEKTEELSVGRVNEHGHHVFKNEKRNIVMFSFGYTYVPQGAAHHHHETDGHFVPSIGLDYKRRINHRWAFSVFTDWEMDHYVLIDKEFEREKAFIAVIGATYELGDGLGLFAGAGREFEHSQNLWVARVGLEYGMELGKRWIVVPSVFYDWKESYNTYSFSLGISRKF